MYCKVTGTGPAYLGRAYKSHSTVVYYQSSFDNIIAPEGWDIMRQAGNELSSSSSSYIHLIDC